MSEQIQLIHPEYLSQESADQLITDHYQLARRVVRGFKRNHRSSLEETELLNCALLGLIDAVNRYNPQKGDNFSSYARIRIRGALLDRVRQEDPLSRSRRSFVKHLESSTRSLERRLHRAPEHSELAEAMGLSTERFAQLLAEVDQPEPQLEELDKELESQLTGGKVSDVLDFEERDPLAKLLHAENSVLIEQALEELSPKQRLCIKLSFYENMALTRIAELLEVSVSRVSQVRTQALEAMRFHLRRYQ